MMNGMLAMRHDWTLAEIQELYDTPLLDLVFQAAAVHREHHDANQVQVCKLISIKTGGCSEDCKYCSQSSRYETEVESSPLMPTEEVLAIAQRAKDAGMTRVCMGAAWREVRDSKTFDRVLDMVKGVNAIGVEVCCTLGMLNEDQAKRLEEAGLYAYNHNLDTSREYYDTIITTRTFDDRLKTIDNIRKTSITVCSGGIMGLGETVTDRLSMLQTLSSMTPHPESVPINILSKVPGTPMADNADVPFFETLKMIAVARILMPKATVRLSAGRAKLSASEQALCFMAGADSFFSSESKVMLTKAVPSPAYDEDKAMLASLGMTMRRPFQNDVRQQKELETAAN
jgi:biotin synthase